MSTQWMQHALIASVLTVLMTLPATAQQRRLSGPAKPASGTPGKLEVPPILRPLVQRAIRATLQLQKARLEVLQVVKQLERLAATADQSSGVSLPTAPTADKSGVVQVATLPTAPTADRIKAGVLQAVAIPAFLRFLITERTQIGSKIRGERAEVLQATETTNLSQMILDVQKEINQGALRLENNMLTLPIPFAGSSKPDSYRQK